VYDSKSDGGGIHPNGALPACEVSPTIAHPRVFHYGIIAKRNVVKKTIRRRHRLGIMEAATSGQARIDLATSLENKAPSLTLNIPGALPKVAEVWMLWFSGFSFKQLLLLLMRLPCTIGSGQERAIPSLHTAIPPGLLVQSVSPLESCFVLVWLNPVPKNTL